jgi:tetratricopeptide (TPR) repeat protein
MLIAPAAFLWLATASPVGQQTPQVPKPEARADQPTAGYYFVLRRYLEGEGQIPDAIEALKHAIQLEPDAAEPRAELAALYARQDRADDAIHAAEDALKVDPQNREANRILGSVLAAVSEQRASGRPAAEIEAYQVRAIAALEIARANTLPDLAVDLTLARLYLAKDRPADAVPLLRRIIDEQPSFGDGWLLLSSALEASDHPDEAADTLKAALEELPTLFRARIQLAELYERERRWPQAADAWADAQEKDQRNTEIAARRAGALLSADKAADARTVITEALKLKPGDARLSYLLAQCERELGNLDVAETIARQLQSSRPDDVRGVYLLAQILESRGRYQEVVDLLKPTIARLKTDDDQASQVAMLLDAQGLALQELQRNDEAIAVFREAVQRAPDEPVRHAVLIQGLTAANHHAQAVTAAEAARQKFPDDSGVAYQLGAALDRSGRRDDAERTFRDIIAHDPLDANALNYLGYMFAEHATRLDEAVSLIQRALKVEPDNPSFLDSLGWAYVQQGKFDLADPPLSTAADKLPKNSVIKDHLGDLRLKQSRPIDAIAAWKRALAGDGDSIDRGKIEQKIANASKQTKK